MDIKKITLICILTITMLLLVSCSQNTISTNDGQSNAEVTGKEFIWQDVILTDINTQTTFTVNKLTSKPILMETFAVWCPTCTKQQTIIHEMLKSDETKDSFHSISLNVDPNEDQEIVQNHIEKNNFHDGLYAIAPIELTQELINGFGNSIASAPQAPIVLICPDGQSELLQRGLKTKEELLQAINSCE